VARAATAARDAVITPLAAAAMEGSYRRAHPAVVQLHLIREAEEAMEAVASLDAAEETRNGANAGSVAERKRGRGVASGHHARVPRDALGPSSASLDVGVERLSDWDPRLALTPSAMATREPILALRRAAYAALGASAEDASAYTWLAQAKLCRASGHAGAAQLALFEARAALESAGERGDALENAKASSGAKKTKTAAGLPAPGMALAVEQAKLLWATGRQHRATVEIQEALDDAALRGADPVAASRAMLRLARWSAATGQRSKTDVLNIYSNVLRDQRHTEKANFHVAKYMDDLLKDAQKRERAKAAATDRDGSSRGDGDGREAYGASRGAAASRAARSRAFDVDERSLDYVVEVIQHYATSLRHGHRHAYESLPRMLTLWFDVGAAAAAAANSSSSTSKERKVATTATNSLRDFSQKLPLYTWLPALPQLTSRLCHPHGETRALIHELLHRLVRNFPNQVLWSMTAMARSTHPDRSASAQRVLDRAKEGAAASARPLFEQSASLCDQLIRVCAFSPKPLANGRPAKSFSVKSEFPALRRLTPCDVLVPNQTQLAPTLPPSRARNAANPNHVPTVSEWNAFPDDVATIAAVEDDVPVLSSLQKPKKLTVIGSDGVAQSFLCKPKDDLRKDLRMMEFTTMLNRLLSRDAASRKRRLYLRTFAVVPLTEDCGLIEWVPHTTGLRHVIQALYVRDGLYHKRTLAEVKETHERLKATPTTWMREILKKFPPVFHRWFLNRWKDRPAAWHGARTAFAHTAAVWSMVGHVVGLGDRHGENILLDQESGDCVHVDFSCLFDKGLELETPEMVPFRLTQNIIDGLGAGGYEGVFMRASEITLSVLRSHREALMSVLETFVHDPLVEWSASRKGGAREMRETASAGGRGKEALDKITSRLEGVVVGVGSAPSLPLSPQGQARRLIEEATSRKGQGSMYIWWMSWM
jgi:serine/threonine-protein kinase ATR